jgi:hypothetical protein
MARSKHNVPRQTNADEYEDDENAVPEVFDLLFAAGKKSGVKATIITFTAMFTMKGKEPVAARCSSDEDYGTYKFIQALNLREFNFDYRHEYDMPRKRGAGLKKLVPAHPSLEHGWWGVRGQVNVDPFLAGRFDFRFEEIRVPVPVAIALLDAVRYRAGLMDFVDLTAADNKSGDSDSDSDSAKRARSD